MYMDIYNITIHVPVLAKLFATDFAWTQVNFIELNTKI